jgi:alkanesulfonate monooxygenase SsuD/methylene tetrahydromethanopterin reductase-like flavin-dependent oxidoreductase (luciferase family)
MKYGLHLAGGALVCGRKELKEVASVAEELGFDSILIGDHISMLKNIEIPVAIHRILRKRFEEASLLDLHGCSVAGCL